MNPALHINQDKASYVRDFFKKKRNTSRNQRKPQAKISYNLKTRIKERLNKLNLWYDLCHVLWKKSYYPSRWWNNPRNVLRLVLVNLISTIADSKTVLPTIHFWPNLYFFQLPYSVFGNTINLIQITAAVHWHDPFIFCLSIFRRK